jgi:hypothetical protein
MLEFWDVGTFEIFLHKKTEKFEFFTQQAQKLAEIDENCDQSIDPLMPVLKNNSVPELVKPDLS